VPQPVAPAGMVLLKCEFKLNYTLAFGNTFLLNKITHTVHMFSKYIKQYSYYLPLSVSAIFGHLQGEHSMLLGKI
jgi:hypothetical protein